MRVAVGNADIHGRTYIVRTLRRIKSQGRHHSSRCVIPRELPATTLAMNDITRISFKLAQPLMVDAYKTNRATGAFILIDESTNNTVGAGMII